MGLGLWKGKKMGYEVNGLCGWEVWVNEEIFELMSL